MKIAAVFVALIAFLGVSANTQTLPPEPPPDLEIVKYSWSKDRIDWERDMTSAESYRETTYRIRNERRTGTPLEERDKQNAREAQKQSTKPARYAFTYKLQVNHRGVKAIREIDWDYVFKDETTGEELGRRQFTSVEKISPGKKKELVVRASAAPTERISIYSLGKDEHAGLSELVVISRVLYDDGTTWVPAEAKGP